jgi:ABC-type dipeptide/oligopeptide/nickel transport system permease subunit
MTEAQGRAELLHQSASTSAAAGMAELGLLVGPEATSGAGVSARSPWRLSVERLRRDRMAMITAGIIVLIVALAVGAPLISMLVGHPPDMQYRDIGLTPDGLPVPPNGTFWLGTDDLGRDLMVRIAYGARISLVVSVVSTAATVLLGTLVGIAAGYYGGVVDTILSWLIDLILSFPFLLLVIALVSLTGPSLTLLVGVIALFGWSSVARVVRGQTLSLRQREFVEAALSLGASDLRLMALDILPNVLAPIIVYTSLLIPSFVVLESTLSFLGLGVPPPTPTWGGMLSDSVTYYRQAWWYVVFPGLALLTTTLAFNLFGDSIRDAFDPRADRFGRR